MARRKYSSGLTLVELMIVVAIIGILSGIAIPLYREYIREAQFGAARMNIEPLRLAIEDHWLDNQSYADFNNKTWNPKTGTETLLDDVGWRPDGDDDAFSYTVTNANAGGYTIVITHLGSGRSVSCPKQADCQYSD